MADRDSLDFSPLPPAPVQSFNRWGLWATLGWSFCIISLFVLSQTMVAVIVIGIAALGRPGVDPIVLAEEMANTGWVLSLATLVSTPICMGAIALFIRWKQGYTVKRYLELDWPQWRSLLVWCLLTLGLIYGMDYVRSLLDIASTSTFTTDMFVTAQFIPLLYLAVGVAAPLFEEVFFRGFMFQGLRQSKVGLWGAVLLPSLLWAVIHLQYDLYDVTSIFIFGVLMGIAQVRTRSLYVPIAMHALNNILALSQVALAQMLV